MIVGLSLHFGFAVTLPVNDSESPCWSWECFIHPCSCHAYTNFCFMMSEIPVHPQTWNHAPKIISITEVHNRTDLLCSLWHLFTDPAILCVWIVSFNWTIFLNLTLCFVAMTNVCWLDYSVWTFVRLSQVSYVFWVDWLDFYLECICW